MHIADLDSNALLVIAGSGFGSFLCIQMMKKIHLVH